ncbi:hypothetical protein IVA95_22585 [Bradyrhizobium sp. 157]|uniref:hypothetical protein n=1 Tax=Bradyrhizobium sp. 157 TaxID=2782631 RepID=UPI001FF9E1DD|nr:hypothetical protein [Bradyrhizobium sp. 157]MCK1640318.1 hypothetical protein [Bradyrhizobium sp. 157]
MHTAIDWIMQTTGNLSQEEERAAREKVSSYRAEKPDETEKQLAIEGLRYLLSVRKLNF